MRVRRRRTSPTRAARERGQLAILDAIQRHTGIDPHAALSTGETVATWDARVIEALRAIGVLRERAPELCGRCAKIAEYFDGDDDDPRHYCVYCTIDLARDGEDISYFLRMTEAR